MSKPKDRYTPEEETENFVDELITYLGPGNYIEGDIVLSERTIIEGAIINGEIDSTAKNSELIIGPETEITGEIKSESLILSGTVRGKIFSKKVTIQKDGVFYGDIVTNRGLNVEVGSGIQEGAEVVQRPPREIS